MAQVRMRAANRAEAAPPPNLATGRKPSQKRSQVRVTALLDAADRLLRERDIHDIGLYDVANLADVPPTSAYHFFPTKESVFLGLAERYLETMHRALEQPFDRGAIERWQDLVTLRYYRVVEYFNANLCARKLFLGMGILSDIKKLDLEDTDKIAASTYASMNQYFEMPYVRDPSFKFTVAYALHDGIWMSSYGKFGHITPEFASEGLRAYLAYISTFLPDTIALRAPPPEDAARDSKPELAAAPPRRRRGAAGSAK
jgi:AcrR family transcriptional regulator